MSDQRAILQRVDLVLAVGTDPFEELFYWGDVILLLDARLVHIDPSPGRIGRSEPTDVGIVGHCASALSDLTAVLMERWSPGDRSEIEERRQAVASEKRNNRENFDKAAADRWDHKPMSPARMMFELAAAVPDNAVVVDDSISNRGARGQAIGGGIGATMGAQCANPDRPVFGVIGDGSAMITVQGLWTAANDNIP